MATVTDATPPVFLDLAAAAARVGLSPRTLRRWCDEYKLKRYRPGVKVLVRVAELDDLIAAAEGLPFAGRTPPATRPPSPA